MRFFVAALLILLPVAAEAAWVADLSWTPSASAKTGTRVERQVGTAAKTVLATVNPGVAVFTDPGPLTAGTAYTYCLIEFNGSGDGPSVCATRTPRAGHLGVVQRRHQSG
jgi:hypothetical protein